MSMMASVRRMACRVAICSSVILSVMATGEHFALVAMPLWLSWLNFVGVASSVLGAGWYSVVHKRC